MITEERFERIEGEKVISGGKYYIGGKLFMQSRYERKLTWFEKLIKFFSKITSKEKEIS